MAKFQLFNDASSKKQLRHGGEIRGSWRTSNFANQGNFAKLANIEILT